MEEKKKPVDPVLLKHFSLFDPSLKIYSEKFAAIMGYIIPENCEYLSYLCPICLNEWIIIDKTGHFQSTEFTEDHFPSESVGGKSKLLVCKRCNNHAGYEYENSLTEKLEEVSFNKKIANSTVRTSSQISDVRGWHHGALSFDEEGKLFYNIKNKGKKKLPELSEWENETNNGGKGWEMKVNVKKVDEGKLTKALLKSAYLFCFLNQISLIRFTHVWKTRTELINILSDKWIWSKKTDMIPDDHNITHFITGVHTSRCIG